ncbi:MAG: Hsp20/alpha crystallin family protein [Dehalococcoidia bacterium]
MGQAKGKRRKEDNPQNQPEKPSEGPVEGVLRGLGEVIPGFGELVKGLEKSEAFQERLEAANAEVEHRMGKAPPSSRGVGARRSIIPPRTNLRASRTALRKEPPAPASQRDVITDMFDEGDRLMVIAELPGVNEKDIEIEVKGDRLVLFARSQGRQYHKDIVLPCTVKVKPSLTYKNGILKISLEKEPK